MFSLRSSVFILTFLCIPYLLKVIKKAEPYPAVIYPSGAAKAIVGVNSINVAYTIFFGRNASGEWNKVDEKRLIHPIPIQNLPRLVSNEFGLKRSAKPVDKKDLAMTGEAKLWLRGQLAKQNVSASALKISRRIKTLSVPAGKILKDKIVYETTLELY